MSKLLLSFTIVLLSCWLAPISLSAQATPDSLVSIYQQTEAALVLLKNENQGIPLRRLDTLKIAYLRFGLAPNSELEQVLQKYTLVDALTPPLGSSTADVENWVNQLQAKYNLFILGINDIDAPSFAALTNQQPYLDACLQKLPTIAVVLGGDRVFAQSTNLVKARSILLAPLQTEFTQSLAAQIVFGGAGTKGRLTKDLSTDFPTGSGLDSPGGLRLGYAPAAMVGFDPQKLVTGIQTIVQQGLDTLAYPGAQVMVIKDGKVVYHQTFGYHTYDKLQPVATTDIYDFASITKVSASLPAVMRLYGEGKLNIDAPLGSIYPDFKNSNKDTLTLRSILAHNAKLMAWIPFWRGTLKGNGRYPWKKKWNGLMNNTGAFKARTFAPDSSARYSVKVTPDMWLHRRYEKEIYKAIKRSPLNAKPGYVYSDLSFYLYPKMLPPITGKDFETYVKETFYEPLGAYTLTFNAWQHFPPSRIVPTENDTFFRKTILHGYVHDEGAGMLNGLSGHAGLFGSAGDLAKLMQMYLNGGTYGGETFLKKEVLDEFKRCAYCNEGNHRALGFDRPLLQYNPKAASYAQSASPESYGHSGYTGTFTWTDPKYNLIYIFFCNRVYPTRDNRKLLDLSIRPRVQQAIYDALLPSTLGVK